MFYKVSALSIGKKIIGCMVRHLPTHGDFPQVDELLLKEKSLNGLRRHRKIMEMLNEKYFKIHTLNMNAFVVCNSQWEAQDMIEGMEILPSPPLTQPPIINYSQSSEGH